MYFPKIILENQSYLVCRIYSKHTWEIAVSGILVQYL